MKRLISCMAVLALMLGYSTSFARTISIRLQQQMAITTLLTYSPGRMPTVARLMIMNVRADGADAAFSDAAQYVFFISSSAGFGAMDAENSAVMCTSSRMELSAAGG